VYISTSGTGAATHLLSVTDWTLNMETQTIDVTDFDSTNQEFIQGWPNRAGTLAGWWRDDEDKLYQAIESGGRLQPLPVPVAARPIEVLLWAGVAEWHGGSASQRRGALHRALLAARHMGSQLRRRVSYE
jgi:hypothetical protein